jgi:signal transduction histidine kinase
VALGDFPVQQADVEETLFRICQEALSNSIRHSGAVRVKISGRATTHTLHVIVQDDGQGFDVAALSTDADHREGGLGLINIRERARALDGMVAIDSRLGVGTRVVIELPRDDRTGS